MLHTDHFSLLNVQPYTFQNFEGNLAFEHAVLNDSVVGFENEYDESKTKTVNPVYEVLMPACFVAMSIQEFSTIQ